MYEEFFGLKAKPFSIVPDPAYFFMSEGHREALAHLFYGIQNEGGFVLLSGEVGTGKTTVCRRLLQLIPDDVEVAFILNPKVTAQELLAIICDEFRIKYPKNTTSIKTLVSRINDYLIDVHGKGRRAVVIVEEAQNLGPEVLEQIRLLTNLETNERKLLQMIMLGQPELRDMLDQPQLRQLSQRITARYHLSALKRDEVPKYVEYRLAAAGLVSGTPFPPRVMARLFHITGGVPRVINVVCDRALLGAYTQGRGQVDMKTLQKAAQEVFGESPQRIWRKPVSRFIVLGLLAAALGGLAVYTNTPFLKSPVSSKRDAKATMEVRMPAKNVQEVKTGERMPVSNSLPPTGNLERPPTTSGPQTKDSAYEALFSLWHIEYAPRSSQTACGQANRQGIGCLSGRGSLIELRQMNRPVVLRLTDQDRQRYYATLVSLKGDVATFRIGNETRLVATKNIGSWWNGDYVVLWRQPPGYKTKLKESQKSPLAKWLAERLSLLSGKPLAAENETYDRSIVEEVKHFQISRGMIPDGVVGPKTIIVLGSAVPDGDPVLSDPKAGT
jgi:general secretion pathway protein A